MAEIFGALSVKKDPISRTADPEWFPSLTGRITEATVPLFTEAGTKAQFRLNDDWLNAIAKRNANNPRGDQIFNPAFGIFVSKYVIQCMPEQGNLLRLSSVDYERALRVGFVKTYNVNELPPDTDNFMTRPDLWMKATLINQYNDFLNPYQGDLYWPLVTDGTQVYSTLDRLEQWPVLPVSVTVRSDISGLNGRSDHVYPAENVVKTYSPGSVLTISKYAAIGCWVWGLTQDNLWVALRVVAAGSDTPIYYTNWQLITPSPFGPVTV